MRVGLNGRAVASTSGRGAKLTCYLEKRPGGWQIRAEEGTQVVRVGCWSDAAGAAEAAQAGVFARQHGGQSFDQVMAWARGGEPQEDAARDTGPPAGGLVAWWKHVTGRE